MKKILNIILLFLILGVAVVFFVLDPTKHSIFPKCMFHSLTGAYCPGCGSQRALHSLLHFDIAGVVNYNFLFLPAALLILYHYIHPLLNKYFKWKLPNLFYLKSTPWVIFVVVILFWIFRNLPWYPFSVLAPA
ncbi:DUF2752 domain-containing protein [Maribellus mangrovi]|uniref:DUF2752 domain-containing protein n=1 Tax=Maribellus mangrovi TaxID=3133146 RepID=UPI0030EBB614